MNDMIPTPSHRLVSKEPPKLSKALDYEVWQAMNPHPDIGYNAKVLPPPVAKEARICLAALDELCRPVTEEALANWMLPLTMSTKNGPDEEGFQIRISLLKQALGDFPIGALTATSQQAAMQTFEFFPSVAEVCKLLADGAWKLRKRRWAMAEIVNNQKFD